MSVLGDKVTQLTADVAAIRSADEALITYVQGVPDLVRAAVDAALEAGATPEQLQALEDLHTGLVDETAAVIAAVPANTP